MVFQSIFTKRAEKDRFLGYNYFFLYFLHKIEHYGRNNVEALFTQFFINKISIFGAFLAKMAENWGCSPKNPEGYL